MAPPAHGLGSVLVDGLVGFVNVILRGEVPLREHCYCLSKSRTVGGCGASPAGESLGGWFQ